MYISGEQRGYRGGHRRILRYHRGSARTRAFTWGSPRWFPAPLLPGWPGGRQVQVGGRVHHVRPQAHQQGLQVVHLYCPPVPSFPQVMPNIFLNLCPNVNIFQWRDCHVYVQLSTRGGVSAPGAAWQAALPGRPVPQGSRHQRLLQGRESLCPAVLL